MIFLDRILAFVRTLPDAGSPPAEFNGGALRQKLEQVLEQRNAAPEEVDWWQTRDVLFFSCLAESLCQTFSVTSTTQLEQLLVLSFSSPTLADFGGSAVRFARFQKLTQEAIHRADAGSSITAPEIILYLHELHVITQCPVGWALTPAGRVLKPLASPEARRWLLHLEVQQSLGADDRWRTHRTILLLILERGGLGTAVGYVDPSSKMTDLTRLSQMGVFIKDAPDECNLSASARPLLEELVADPPTSLAILARTLTQDAQDHAFQPYLGVPTSSRIADHLLFARMVAHEIRNAIVPVKTTLQHLFEDLPQQPNQPALAHHRNRMERGIDRVLHFVEEQVHTAARGLPPLGPFSLQESVQQAILRTETERNGRVTVDVRSLPEVQLTGLREPFILVLINLLRNAAQAQLSRPVKIQLHGSVSDEHLHLFVDDDGPGVPLPDRQRIFESGYSTHNSTGQGLAIAQQVIREMRGEVTCDTAPTGGARFILRIPIPPRTP